LAPNELSTRGRKLLAVLNEHGDWINRAELAHALDLPQLSSNDNTLLRQMVEKGLIEVRKRHPAPQGTAYEYRVKR
jgi:DNA-binding IclR family transcriptional regulator